MSWEKFEKVVRANGETDITYRSEGVESRIVSRKKAIPHANGVGTWMHTSYFVVNPDGSEKEFYTLKDAKEAAEREVNGSL